MAFLIIMQLMAGALPALIAEVRSTIITSRDILNRVIIVPRVAGIALGAEFDEGHWALG